ncbi:MAG: hypothetical protein Tp138OMZ00d2C19078241_17 [Prokaryotic dsDNA virus sp.]|jgi:hypothetical protein|nr:MAG: hypothetical protein Tp138OMZ00d2C19078241_17 [Prokaryotic dsDNA virus sp.]|tara:strand:- start:30281 stop:31357 length:1077 start_codon:yes stop_codon:yes gene_type:complete
MASGDFTPFATQQAVQQAQTTADSAATAVGDANSGLTKDVADLQAETANLQQLIDNMSDPVFALTTHTPSGVYTAGQTVYVGGSQYRANSDMDGSVTPISFAIGSGANQWTPASKHNKELDMIVEYGGYQFKASPAGVTANDGTNLVGIALDPASKRVRLAAQGPATIAAITDTDFVTYADLTAEIDPIQTQVDSKKPKAEIVGTFGYDTINANNWVQHNLGDSDYQFMYRKNGNSNDGYTLKVGFDSDTSTSANLQGSVRLYTGDAAGSSGTWDQDRPIFSIIDGDSNNGVVEVLDFTPGNYTYIEFDVTIVKRGQEPSGLTNAGIVRTFKIRMVTDDFSSTANDFAVIIDEVYSST